MKNKSRQLIFALLISVITSSAVQAQEEATETPVDCSHLTAEQLGDKNACWSAKKAEMGLTKQSTESYVEIVSGPAPYVNVTPTLLGDQTIFNLYSVPSYKDAAPSSVVAPGNSDQGDGRPGNQ
jgi:hypothetical protein